MNAYTLTLYTIASGLCFCLSLLLLAFTQIRRGTFLLRSAAWGLATMAIGFLGAGIGPLMPFWFTVIGMNAVLLSAGLIFYSGVRALVFQQTPQLDKVGVGIVALSMPFFVYWGFVEPDGMRRAVVFSFAQALIHGRTTKLLITHLRLHRFNGPLLLMTSVLGTLSAWMLARGLYLVFATPLPTAVKATNPTTWPTVFAFNVLISVFVASLMAAEIRQQRQSQQQPEMVMDGTQQSMRDNLVLLWGIVAVMLIAILSEVGIGYLVLYQLEQQQLKEQNGLTNQALVEHTQQLINQTDLVLHVVREVTAKGDPQQVLGKLLDGLNTQQTVFQKTYIANAEGVVLYPPNDRQKSIQPVQNENFQFHKEHAQDILHVGPTSPGPISGALEFWVSRRINDAQGHFAGMVAVAMDPGRLAQYYQTLITSNTDVAALLGDDDHRIRARLPLLDASTIQQPLQSPLWHEHPDGSGYFRTTSMVDGAQRYYYYRRLQDLPLVMVTGFSDADIHRSTLNNLRPVAFGALLAMAVVVAMAFMLAAALRRRDEQDRFLSMISHELRTPMSVIRMVSGADEMPVGIKNRVIRAVNDMGAIINSALQADRLRSGRVRANVSVCSIRELMDMVVQNAAAPDRVRVHTAAVHALETVPTDPQLFKVVIGNLVDNALKYSPQQSTVNVTLQGQAHQRRPGLSVEVSNAVGGVGLPDENQLFRKFYRAPGARGKTGSGLGLHIAEGLANLLGGHLKYSVVADAVKFTLWIPL